MCLFFLSQNENGWLLLHFLQKVNYLVPWDVDYTVATLNFKAFRDYMKLCYFVFFRDWK